ncbi:MAG: pseudouridine synthase [Parachlamydiales bacterium]|jgi:23S rRNA pseudouridine2605 synthase
MTLKRLNKFLSECGIASRRKAEDLIASNLITVNGKKVNLPQTIIDSDKDVVKINNKVISEEKKYYFILNKPKGFICSNTRKIKENLVIDLFKNYSCKLFTVGRLDKDTTGLLLVTNDGDFANKVIHPSADLQKEYLAKVKENISEEHLKIISKGAFVENRFVKPIKVLKIRRGTLKIIVKEGKKREVKTFIQKANLNLIELTRIRIGNLMLGSIPYGYFKQVTLQDVEKVF